jgi:signal peptidase I
MTQSTNHNASEPTPQSGIQKAASLLRELIETVLIAVIIFLLLQIVVKNFRVTGESMQPSFVDGQFLLVDKISYRFVQPKRGDVVVFRYPRDPGEDFIKRIVGLPGETVRIAEGNVYIDGDLLLEPYLQGQSTLNYRSLETALGEDEFFVLGDNRRYSSDSRTWGPVARRDIVGRAWFSYWPPSLWGIVRTPAYP